MHNFESAPREIRFSVGGEGEHSGLLVNLLGDEHNKADEKGKHVLLIEGYGYRWFRVGGLDYLLRRTDIDQAKSSAKRRR